MGAEGDAESFVEKFLASCSLNERQAVSYAISYIPLGVMFIGLLIRCRLGTTVVVWSNGSVGDSQP
jgi:hypothetical protein